MNSKLIKVLYLQKNLFMKKKLLSGSLAFLCLLAACQSGQQPENKDETPAKEAPAAEDTTLPVLGGDRDKHGCIPSAGYTWSILKNNCVRLFEEKGVSMEPVDNKESYVSVAVVLFDETRTKAELFLPTDKESILLERKSPGDSTWRGNDFEFIHEKKYALKKAGTKIYQEP